MKKGLKITLIAVGSFLGLVALDLGVSLIYNKANEATNTHELESSFNKIKIDVSTSDIEIIKANDGKGKVVCKETKKIKHDVKVEDETLKINFNYKYRFSLFMFTPSFKVQVYVPSNVEYELNSTSSTGELEVGSDLVFTKVNSQITTGNLSIASNVKNEVKIKLTTGDVSLSKMSPNSINIETSTGKIELKDIGCSGDIELKSSTGSKYLENLTSKNLTNTSSTGDLKLKKVVLSEKLNSTTTTGKIKLSESDAKEVDIKTTTGDVDAEFLSDKIVYAKTSTGDVDVPKSTTGGLCSIETTTGDIKVTIKK